MRKSIWAASLLLSSAAALAQIPTPQPGATDVATILSPKRDDAAPVSAAQLIGIPAISAGAWGADGESIFLSSNISGRFNIWKTDGEGRWPVRITQSEETQKGIVPLSDGKTLLFLQDKGGDENYDIYRVPVTGGTPENITNSPSFAEANIRVSPNGTKLVFTYQAKTGSQRDIAVMDLATRAVVNLTQEKDPEGYWSGPSWSPDGKSIIANREINLLAGDATVWKLDVATGKASQLIPTRRKGRDIAVGMTADGKSLVVTTNFQSTQERAALFDLASKSYRWFAKTPWEQKAVMLSPDRRSALLRVWEDGQTKLSVADLATLAERPVDLPPGVNDPLGGRWAPDAQPFSPDGTRLLLTHSAGDTPPEIRVSDVSTGASRIIARMAPDALASGRLPKSSVVSYRSFDGTLVSGILTMPFNLERDGSHPAVVIPHGGPTDAASDVFSAKAAFLASRGYLVLQPNYRGSTGYGTPFQEAERHDMGNGDLKDVLAAKDFLVATGYVHPKRVGISGNSGGGWLTMLALSKQPGVFSAGVQFVGVTDWFKLIEGTDGFIRSYIMSLLGDPVKDKKAYETASPITYIDNINVPLLSFAGDRDIRVPAQQAVQVDAALKARGVKTDIIVYQNEGHNFAKSENRIDSLERMADWFDETLKNNR